MLRTMRFWWGKRDEMRYRLLGALKRQGRDE
jgi:hypothetical protein